MLSTVTSSEALCYFVFYLERREKEIGGPESLLLAGP